MKEMEKMEKDPYYIDFRARITNIQTEINGEGVRHQRWGYELHLFFTCIIVVVTTTTQGGDHE